MKLNLLFFLFFCFSLTTSFAQHSEEEIQRAIADFHKNIESYQLPASSVYVYLKGDSYLFVDKDKNPVNSKVYKSIRGAHGNFVVQDKSGYQVLSDDLTPMSSSGNDTIESARYKISDYSFQYVFKLTKNTEISYLKYDSNQRKYVKIESSDPNIIIKGSPSIPPLVSTNSRYHTMGNKVTDPSYTPKSLREIRMGYNSGNVFNLKQKRQMSSVKLNDELFLKTKNPIGIRNGFILEFNKFPSTAYTLYHSSSSVPLANDVESVKYYDTLLFVTQGSSVQKKLHIYGESGTLLFALSSEKFTFHAFNYQDKRINLILNRNTSKVTGSDEYSLINLQGEILYTSEANEQIEIRNQCLVKNFETGTEQYAFLFDDSTTIQNFYNDLEERGALVIGEIDRNTEDVYSKNGALLLKNGEYIRRLSLNENDLTFVYNSENGGVIATSVSGIRHKSEFYFEKAYDGVWLKSKTNDLFGFMQVDEDLDLNQNIIEPAYYAIGQGSRKLLVVLTQGLKIVYVTYDGVEMSE